MLECGWQRGGIDVPLRSSWWKPPAPVLFTQTDVESLSAMCPEAWMDSDVQEIMFRLRPLPCTCGFTRCSAERVPELGQGGQTCTETQLIKPRLNRPRYYSSMFSLLTGYHNSRRGAAGPAVDPWNGTLPGWKVCGEPAVLAAITPAWGWGPSTAEQKVPRRQLPVENPQLCCSESFTAGPVFAVTWLTGVRRLMKSSWVKGHLRWV